MQLPWQESYAEPWDIRRNRSTDIILARSDELDQVLSPDEIGPIVEAPRAAGVSLYRAHGTKNPFCVLAIRRPCFPAVAGGS